MFKCVNVWVYVSRVSESYSWMITRYTIATRLVLGRIAFNAVPDIGAEASDQPDNFALPCGSAMNGPHLSIHPSNLQQTNFGSSA